MPWPFTRRRSREWPTTPAQRPAGQLWLETVDPPTVAALFAQANDRPQHMATEYATVHASAVPDFSRRALETIIREQVARADALQKQLRIANERLARHTTRGLDLFGQEPATECGSCAGLHTTIRDYEAEIRRLRGQLAQPEQRDLITAPQQ